MPTSTLLADNTPAACHPLFQEAWQEALALLAPTPAELERGLELHRNLTICDAYGFLPGTWTPEAEETHRKGADGRSHIDWTRRMNHLRTIGATASGTHREQFRAALKQAGIHGIVQPVNDYGEAIACAVQRIAAFRHLCLNFPDTLSQTIDPAGIERARANDSTAMIFSLTGMPIFGAHDMTDPAQLLEWVLIWHSMGVRFMHLGYNRRNLFADGCTELADGGLSDLGRDLIAMMNEVGIIVDVPHSSRLSLLEACKISETPVIASHTGCKAVWNGTRCKSDGEIKAIAETGGYVGIYGIPQHLGDRADLRLMLRHLEHAIRLVGAEHVVIGTDAGYNAPAPAGLQPQPGAWRKRKAGGWNERTRFGEVEGNPLKGSLAWTNKPLLTVGLIQMGLSDDEIAQIHFGNLKRVLDAVSPPSLLPPDTIVSFS
ncbi:MAG TPA: membrane dipeptidase [Chthoniobacteraceae bacterium]|nr:membrane dipeptidase [Chthoniobacteraceae bacterium]